MTALASVAAFIAKWQGVQASELSTAQSFTNDLCDLLGQPHPHPTSEQSYMFQRPITFQHGDGSTSAGRVDCYKRSHFVLEAKKLKAGSHTKGFDDGLLRARSQAEAYARALPAAEGRPVGTTKPTAKQVVTVRYSPKLLAAYKAKGAGWRARMNDALRDWLRTHTPF